MSRAYVISDGDALFFATREQAEEFQQEEYYSCTGDVRPVPDGATHYRVVDNKGIVYCVFFNEIEVKYTEFNKEIKVPA